MNPDDDTIRDILTHQRRMAVIGFSKNPMKDAHTVPMYLHERGYDVIPVNPTAAEIGGLQAYPTLKQIPRDYDMVVLFRPSEAIPQFVDEAIEAAKAKVIWMQTGIRNEEAAARAREAGMAVVQDRCLRVEVRRLGIGPFD